MHVSVSQMPQALSVAQREIVCGTYCRLPNARLARLWCDDSEISEMWTCKCNVIPMGSHLHIASGFHLDVVAGQRGLSNGGSDHQVCIMSSTLSQCQTAHPAPQQTNTAGSALARG